MSTITTLRLVPIGIDAWRVVHHDRGAIGQVRAVTDERGTHFSAQRFHGSDRRMHPVGRFWDREDAVDALVRSV